MASRKLKTSIHSLTIAALAFIGNLAEARKFLIFGSNDPKETQLEKAQRQQAKNPSTKYNTPAQTYKPNPADRGFMAPVSKRDPFIHNGPPEVFDKGDYQIVHYEGEVPQRIYKDKNPNPNQVIARQTAISGLYQWTGSYDVDAANANAGRCLLEGIMPAMSQIMADTNSINPSPVTMDQITGKNGPFKGKDGKLLNESFFVPMGTGDLQTFAIVGFSKGRVVSYMGANGTTYGPRWEPGYTQHLLILDPSSFGRKGPIVASVKPEVNVNSNGNYSWHKYQQNVVESIDHFPSQQVPNPRAGTSMLTNILKKLADSPQTTAYLNLPENAKKKELVQRECTEHALDVEEGKFFNYDSNRSVRTLAGVEPGDTRAARELARDATRTAAGAGGTVAFDAAHAGSQPPSTAKPN